MVGDLHPFKQNRVSVLDKIHSNEHVLPSVNKQSGSFHIASNLIKNSPNGFDSQHQSAGKQKANKSQFKTIAEDDDGQMAYTSRSFFGYKPNETKKPKEDHMNKTAQNKNGH